MKRGRGVRSRLRLRLIASSAALSLLVVILAVASLIGVLRGEFDREITARLTDRGDALAAIVSVNKGVIDVTGADEALFDTPNWVFDANGRRIEGQRPPVELRVPVTALSFSRTTTVRSLPDWRLRAVPVRDADGAVMAVAVTGIDRRPYAASLDATTQAASVLGLLAVLGATALTAVVLARGLGPIAVMTEQAASWSRAHSHRRFALGQPRDEVTRLAAVLDDLLDRVEDALESERRLTAEIAHELRTPLTALRGEAEIALMTSAGAPETRLRFERIRDAAVTMATAITTLLDAERTGRGPHGATFVVDGVVAAAAALSADERIVVEGDARAITSTSADELQRIVSPLLDNALGAARTRVLVQVASTADEVTITVSDDGDGVDPAMESRLFSPGVSSREGGTGLGLGIARRLAAAAGGDVVLVSARPAVFRVVLPAAELPAPRPVQVR